MHRLATPGPCIPTRRRHSRASRTSSAPATASHSRLAAMAAGQRSDVSPSPPPPIGVWIGSRGLTAFRRHRSHREPLREVHSVGRSPSAHSEPSPLCFPPQRGRRPRTQVLAWRARCRLVASSHRRRSMHRLACHTDHEQVKHALWLAARRRDRPSSRGRWREGPRCADWSLDARGPLPGRGTSPRVEQEHTPRPDTVQRTATGKLCSLGGMLCRQLRAPAWRHGLLAQPRHGWRTRRAYRPGLAPSSRH